VLEAAEEPGTNETADTDASEESAAQERFRQVRESQAKAQNFQEWFHFVKKTAEDCPSCYSMVADEQEEEHEQ
jgi:hypothetical protein